MSSSTTEGQICWRWRNFRSQSTSQGGSTRHNEQEASREDWISLMSLCCILDIHIFNPVPLSIKTRSARRRDSGIARQVPTDLRGRSAVLKLCDARKDIHGALEYDFESLVKEILILTHPSLQAHPNIARLMGLMWEDDRPGLGLGIGPVLVLDFADRGTLLEIAERKPSLHFLDKVELSLGVGEAITTLHECGIIHGDVKLENVLVQTGSDGKLVPKLTDFDLSLISPMGARRLPGWSHPWNAPEYREELCSDCLKLTDVFSFGMLVWRLFLNGGNPLQYYDDLGLDDVESVQRLKSTTGLLTRLTQTFEVLDLKDKDLELINVVLQNTLPCDPVLRHLGRAVSALRSYPQGSTQHERVTTTLDGAMEVYEAATRDRDYLDIDYYHLRFTDPKFKIFLVEHLEVASSLSENQRRKGELLLQLSAAFFNGFGVERHIEYALSLLIQSAESGCIRAQAIVRRVHDSLGIECVPGLPIRSWLVAGAETGSIIATEDLKMYYPEDFINSTSVFRTDYGGRGRPLDVLDLSDQDNSLHVASMKGDLDAVLRLLTTENSSSTVNSQNRSGETPLLCACQSGHAAVVEVLLENGADPSVNAHSGEGPLHWITSFTTDELPRIGQLLLNGGAALYHHARRNSSCFPHLFNGLDAGTPLLRAVARRNIVAVEWLLSRGARPTVNQYDVESSLIRRQDVYLLGDTSGGRGLRGNPLTSIRQHRASPLAYAAMSHLDSLPVLLGAKTEDLLNCHSTRPAGYGFWEKIQDIAYVKTLSLTADSSTRASDSDAFSRLYAVRPEFTLLFYACVSDSFLQRLVTHGASFKKQMETTVDLLIRNGSSLSQVNKFRGTALHAAVEGGHVDIAEHLLRNHPICREFIDAAYAGFLDLAPLHISIFQEDFSMFQLVLDHGASTSWGIESCFFANHQNLSFIQELIRRGAVPGSNRGRSYPFVHVLLRRHFTLADLIVANWPDELKHSIPGGFNVLMAMVMCVCLNGLTDISPLTHLIKYLRQHNLVLCGPENYYKADIFALAIVSSWGQQKLEDFDEDWEQSRTIKLVLDALLREYGHHASIDLSKAVSSAVHYRDVTALKTLLEFGADPNSYVSAMLGEKIGYTALDAAFRTYNSEVSDKVRQAGDRAARKYKARSEEMVSVLRAHGAQTLFEMRGEGYVYGQRVVAFIGYVITFKVLGDIFDGILSFPQDATIWGANKRRWINNNLPYF